MKSLPMGMFFSMHVCSFLAARKRTVYVYCNVQNRSVHCTCVYMYMFNSTVYMYMYMYSPCTLYMCVFLVANYWRKHVVLLMCSRKRE